METNKEIDLEGKVTQELDIVRRVIGNSNIYSNIIKEISESTRNTAEQVSYLDAYEKALGIFRATSLELRDYIDIRSLKEKLGALNYSVNGKAKDVINLDDFIEEIRQIPKDDKIKIESDMLVEQIANAIYFTNRYALYFAGLVGLELLNSKKPDVIKRFAFGNKYESSVNRDKLTSLLTDMTNESLIQTINDEKKEGHKITDNVLKNMLEVEFARWINQFNWLRFNDVTEKYQVDKLKLKFGNYSLLAGEFKKKYDIVEVDDKFMNVRKEDVIGSVMGDDEFGGVLWNNLIKLGFYDHETRKNPFDPASVVFTYGEPGGGKTFVSNALVQSFADLCREKKIPLWALTHSSTDYASHFQNKTANELAILGHKIREHHGPVVMYIADANNIFLSRQDPNVTAEQQNTMAVYFKMFDGTMIPKNGKFMAIMDANYITGIDPATKSRIFDEIVELKRFTNPEDFAKLAKVSLTKGLNIIPVEENDWQVIGKYLLDSPLSNREIGHIIKKLRRGFNVPEDMLGSPLEKVIEYRNEKLKDINKDLIINTFNEYIETRMRIERTSEEQQVVEDYERFKSFLEKGAKSTESSSA